jgi:hypothetical protein
LLRGRAAAAWRGAAATEHGVRDEDEADGEVCVEVSGQREVVTALLLDARSRAAGGLGIDDGELRVGGAPGELLTDGGTAAGNHDDHFVVGLKCGEGARRGELTSAEDEDGCLRSRTER